MARPLNRMQPVGPPEAYKTYQVVAPKSTHTRPATCEEVGCEPFLKGWTTRLDRAAQAGMIDTLKRSGRPIQHQWTDGPVQVFLFAPGTPCFKSSQHRAPLHRPPLHVVRDGDWRGNPRDTAPIIRSRADWLDDFANHQAGIASAVEKG